MQRSGAGAGLTLKEGLKKRSHSDSKSRSNRNHGGKGGVYYKPTVTAYLCYTLQYG